MSKAKTPKNITTAREDIKKNDRPTVHLLNKNKKAESKVNKQKSIHKITW